MFPLTLTNGIIINLSHARMLIPYTDNTYTIIWENGETLDMTGNDAVVMTTYLTKNGVTINRTLTRPKVG